MLLELDEDTGGALTLVTLSVTANKVVSGVTWFLIGIDLITLSVNVPFQASLPYGYLFGGLLCKSARVDWIAALLFAKAS